MKIPKEFQEVIEAVKERNKDRKSHDEFLKKFKEASDRDPILFVNGVKIT